MALPTCGRDCFFADGLPDLLPPNLPRQKTQIIEADCRRLPPAGQSPQHLRREIGQPQLAADVPFRQPDRLGQFLDGGELTGINASSPPPCAADGTQDVRVLRLILAGPVVGGRQNLRPPVFLRSLN
ncbi:hypothetical protein [Lacimonas salitolerans]|uniref:hypothetical protein n=1 Tax=Lacimonas salitolerans TaxID=1323750 RepID=UPI0036D42C9A